MAIPFAWVKTEEEAQDLIVLHCAFNQRRKVHQVRVTWSEDDIKGAVKSCRARFGFTE